jgi:plasmid replication initiation protein
MTENNRNLSDQQVATQRNDLLHGQQSLSLIQKRIFALTIQQIRRNDTELQTYTIQIQDLVDAGTSSQVFSQIEKEAENLMRKILLKKERVPGWKFPRTTRWAMVSKAVHNPGEGTLDIRIDSEIRDMLLKLKEQGNFTPVPIAELLACRSTYGQRIYELLYSQRWKETAQWEVSVDDLRFSLGLENKYRNFSDFRRYVLKKAQKDLQKHTNMRFEWSQESRGKGRKITHLIFDFSFKPDQMNLLLDGSKEAAKVDLQYNLKIRLKSAAKLNGKRLITALKWLKANPGQQWPLACWLSSKVECDKPTDSLGNAIRDMQAWAWDKISKAMESGGFPTPDIEPSEAKEINPEMFEQDAPGYNPNNPFNEMRPN